MCWINEEEYLRMRARECRQSAENANDKGVRKVRLDFARRYDEAADEQQHQPVNTVRQTVTIGD